MKKLRMWLAHGVWKLHEKLCTADDKTRASVFLMKAMNGAAAAGDGDKLKVYSDNGENTYSYVWDGSGWTPA